MDEHLGEIYSQYGRNFLGREGEPENFTRYRAGHLEEANNAMPGVVLFAVNKELVFKGDLKLLIKLAQLAGVSPTRIDFSLFNLNNANDSH